MCGIAGIIHWGACADAEQRVERMKDALRHRGPDGDGSWTSCYCALGHVRLSIVDIEHGRQPMTSEDGQVTVVYNGEIYNHRELRRELERLGHVFSSHHSDTEVLVHGYESWGEKLLPRLNGMFAFAIWDDRKNSLLLGRDRYGIKPLYVWYGPDNDLVFASEVRGILASNLLPKEESHQALLEYLSLQNMLTGRTLFKDILQFPAGHWEKLSMERSTRSRYWDLSFPRSFKGSLESAATEHRNILESVISRQVDSDVPIATYLSGGIDSSSIAVASYRKFGPIRGYSCLFDLEGVGQDRIVDEREFARTVAEHINLEHVILELPQTVMKECLDHTIAALEYPRMGMSYPNYLIAQRVSRDVKVVMSGMGGDEFHGGYLYRYQAMKRPPAPQSLFRSLFSRFVRSSNEREHYCLKNKKTFRSMLNFPVPEANLSEALTPEFLASAEGFSPTDVINSYFEACPSDDPWDLVMYVDGKAYLHGLLVLEDKLSMAHALETRVPLLDNELVDFVLDLPWPFLCDGNIGKRVFRESVRPWVPEIIYSKPKMGFGPPDASWYRRSLRGWIQEELSEKKIRNRGIFRPEFVRKTLEDHFSERRNNVYMIWSLLNVERWCRIFGMFGG